MATAIDKLPGIDAQRSASLRDLRDCIDIARQRGEVEVIRGADPYLEMGALYELSLRDWYPKVLIFEQIKGFDPSYRVAMNVKFSKLFVGDLSMEAVKARRIARKNQQGDPIPPTYVDAGPITKNIVRGDAIDVRTYPAATWHEGDGGAYIGTECLVITKDPDSDWINVGTYRVQVHDKNILTVFIEPGKHGDHIRKKWWARGQECPIAIVVGQAPVLGNLAGLPLNYGVSEFDACGGMIGESIRVIRGEKTGLPIPADAELAFEGFVPDVALEHRIEGPFAEWTGYYASAPHPEPIVRVETVYHRDDLIVLGQPPAKPTFPGRQLNIDKSAALWNIIEAAGVPGVTGVWKPLGAGSMFVNLISMTQMHEGHAKMVGLVATGAGPNAFLGRFTIIVDDDIDITDPAQVMWALATRWDPKTQTDIIDGCWTGNLDTVISPENRAVGNFTNSRAIIYAVKPFRWMDQFPKVNVVPPEYSAQVEAKWHDTLSFLQDFKDMTSSPPRD